MPHGAPSPVPLAGCILVIEDEPLIRFAIAEALREEGLTVIEAATADEARAYVVTGGAIDAVFADHNLPGEMTGVQFARWLQGTDPGIPVIMTTGRASIEGWHGPLLYKPYDIRRVVSVLTEAVKTSAPRDHDI